MGNVWIIPMYVINNCICNRWVFVNQWYTKACCGEIFHGFCISSCNGYVITRQNSSSVNKYIIFEPWYLLILLLWYKVLNLNCALLEVISFGFLRVWSWCEFFPWRNLWFGRIDSASEDESDEFHYVSHYSNDFGEVVNIWIDKIL